MELENVFIYQKYDKFNKIDLVITVKWNVCCRFNLKLSHSSGCRCIYRCYDHREVPLLAVTLAPPGSQWCGKIFKRGRSEFEIASLIIEHIEYFLYYIIVVIII